MKIIQVGCNDCNDHVFDFVKQNQDQINFFLAIDAMPKCTEIASEKYSFLGEKLHILTTAVADKNGIFEFFYPESDDKSAHASLLQNHLTSHHHTKLKSFTSPCLSLDCILDSYGNDIDRLYLDMEGLDVLTLLNSNLEKNKIKYIEYEFSHSDGPFSAGANHKNLLLKLEKLNFSYERSSEYNMRAFLK